MFSQFSPCAFTRIMDHQGGKTHLHSVEAQHGGAGPAAVDVLRHGAVLLGKCVFVFPIALW